MLCSLSKVGERDLDEIKSLEKKLGKTILAYKCSRDTKPAELSEEELERVREVEDKLHLSLVVVEY